MCIRCACRSIKEDIEDNYILNRDQIIERLYLYLSHFNKYTRYEKDELDEESTQKFFQSVEKLRSIQQMIESDVDVDDILLKLEILEVSMDFLQRHAIDQDNKIRGICY